MIGGLIPLIHLQRTRYTVETTWSVEITWLRTIVRLDVTR